MLKWVRKYSRSWFIAIAIGAIAVVFIFWGVGTMNSPQFQQVAAVNGSPIAMTAYLRQYNDLVKEYQQRSQAELTPEMIKMMRFKEMALNRLIQEELLLQAGIRLGLQVSDGELQQQIQSYPFFQQNGKFDEKRYFWVLSRSRLNPQEFEEQERRRLLLKKVLDDVGSFVKVSDGELKEAFRMEKEAVAVNYLVVSPERFLAQVEPGEADVAKYYQEHQAEFKVPDRVRVSYLLFKLRDFQEQAKVTPAAVEKYLDDHSEEYTRAKVIRARQILLPLAPKATPAERQKIASQAAALEQQAREGADFADLAREHSQDAATKDKGGDLGDVRRGQQPAEWEKIAFSLPPGEVGQATTPQAIYLIKVDEVREKERIPEAAAKAGKRLQEEQTRRLAREKAEQARKELSGGNLAAVAKKLGLSPQETPLMAMKDPVPGLGVQPSFNQVALGLKPQEVGRLVELPDGLAVLQGVERQVEHLPPLMQIKEKVRAAVKQQQAAQKAEAEAARLLKELRGGKTLAQVAAPAGLKVENSGLFTRTQGFLGQHQDEALNRAAFLLSRENPYPPQPLAWQHKYYLLAFSERREPDAKEFDKVRETLKKQVLEQKRQVMLSSWLDAERQQAKIKIFELP